MKSQERNVKEKYWDQIKSEVDRICDRLGKKIDPEIKESVIALQALNFKTSASCQGHLNHGLAAPWIDIGESKPKRSLEKRSIKEQTLLQIKRLLRKLSPLLDKFHKGLAIDLFLPRKNKKQIKVMTEKNLKGQMRLMELLDEFYKDREISSDIRLILRPRGGYGKAWLTSRGARFQEIRSQKEREEKLKQYQQEMNAFTNFLKKKYFETKRSISASDPVKS